MSDDPDVPEEPDGTAEPPEDEPTHRTMSTDTTDATAATAASAPTDDTADESPEGGIRDDPPEENSRDLVRYARYALLGGLTLLALVATLRFYFAASNAIDIWVARQYRPLFQAAFNLVVLLVAAVGISWELRKVAG